MADKRKERPWKLLAFVLIGSLAAAGWMKVSSARQEAGIAALEDEIVILKERVEHVNEDEILILKEQIENLNSEVLRLSDAAASQNTEAGSFAARCTRGGMTTWLSGTASRFMEYAITGGVSAGWRPPRQIRIITTGQRLI